MAMKKIRLDFTKTEERSGWNTRQMPEGLHRFKISDVEQSEAKDGTDMLIYALVPEDGRYKTRRFPFYCKLQANQLWKLRDLLVAGGVAVPKKALNIDPSSVVGKIVAGEVEDETGQYAGRSTVNGIYGLDVLDDGITPDSDSDDEEDEEAEYEDEDESEETDDAEDEADDEDDEEEEDAQDLSELSLVELRKLAKGLGVDTAGLKKPELVEAIEEAEAEGDEDDEEDDDLDDEDLADEEFEDDDEEEPAPVKRKAPVRKAAPAKAAPAKRVVKRR